jgi:RyR domain
MSASPHDGPSFEEKIARVCHEANRGIQAAWPADGIPVAPPWEDLDPETQASILAGVMGVIEGLPPAASHEAWCEHKRANGWTYGPVKSSEAKTHPCLLPYAALPVENAIKDHVFGAIVRQLVLLDRGPLGLRRAA